MKKSEENAAEFVKNSIRIIRVQRNQENNIRSVLEFYRSISTMMGPEEEMGRIFDGLQSIKILIESLSVDDLSYNLKVISSIEDNFEAYFQETRYPSENQKNKFQKFLKEKTAVMEIESELMDDFQKQLMTKKHYFFSPY